MRGFSVIVYRSLVQFALLPKEAWMYTDAAVRACYRMRVSHKNLLNWITSDEAAKSTKGTLGDYISKFWVNYVASLVIIVLFLFSERYVIDCVSAIFCVVIWCGAPFLMFWLLKTYVIIIRHFSFKDTMLFFVASFGKVAIMGLTMTLTGFFFYDGVVTMLLLDGSFTVLVLCAIRLLMIYVFDAYKQRVRDLQKRSRVLVYGTNDKVLNRAAYDDAEKNRPSDATEVILDGGNHAFFGNYGAQSGDGEAAITREEQQKQTVNAILEAEHAHGIS